MSVLKAMSIGIDDVTKGLERSSRYEKLRMCKEKDYDEEGAEYERSSAFPQKDTRK
jgi:hypothetical protein